ncbi:hypothetical protein F4X90_17345 [Candidatus Poribacteria bacterium]|nr:hypothetical protein [Candidatus Poribacteria bacterium]
MPLGRFLRFAGRAANLVGAGAVGTVLSGAGNAIRRRTQRRSMRTQVSEQPLSPVGQVQGGGVQLRNAGGYSQSDINRARIRAGQVVGSSGALALLGSGGAAGRAASLVQQGLRAGRVRQAAAVGAGALAAGEIADQVANTGTGLDDLPGAARNVLAQVQTRLQGGTRMPTNGQVAPDGTLLGDFSVYAALLDGRRGRSRKGLLRDLFISSGALDEIALPPLEYVSQNGGVKYGSYKGYVIVNWVQGGVRYKRQMPKFIATELGFYRRRKKPVLSVRDTQAIRRARIAKRRAAKVAKDAGNYVRSSAPRRAAPTTRRRTTRRR